MKKIPFAIAVLVVAIAITSLCRVNAGNNKEEKQVVKSAEISLNRTLRAPWESGITFAMQWNDACKKLLFDGYPMCHEDPVVYVCWRGGGRMTITDGPRLTCSTPAPEHPDEYSFHVDNIGGLAASSDSITQDGLVHYTLEWSEAKGAFVFPEQRNPVAEMHFDFCTSFPR
jgi:hypothetical protein